MDLRHEADLALIACEERVRELCGTAMSEGSFDLAEQLLSVAKLLRHQRLWHSREMSQADAPRTRPTETRAMQAGSTRLRTTAKANAKPSASGAPKSKAAKYPHFQSKPEHLVRIGWSRKAKEPYEHHASWEVVESMLEHVRANTEPERVWSVDSLTPVPAPDGEELPSYKVYLIIAWLRDAGLIQKHGRHGYSYGPRGLGNDVIEDAKNRF